MKKRVEFILGIAICVVAILSVMLEKIIPGEILGSSIIALFVGTIINSFFHPDCIKPALKFTSKRVLKIAIILLGASLSVGTIMNVGKMTFFVMLFTFAMCFGGGYFVRKIFGLNWKLSNLISAGTGICGGSAIAAIGLGTSITDFKKAGLSPMFYGITIDTLVTLTALVVVWCMGLM